MSGPTSMVLSPAHGGCEECSSISCAAKRRLLGGGPRLHISVCAAALIPAPGTVWTSDPRTGRGLQGDLEGHGLDRGAGGAGSPHAGAGRQGGTAGEGELHF